MLNAIYYEFAVSDQNWPDFAQNNSIWSIHKSKISRYQPILPHKNNVLIEIRKSFSSYFGAPTYEFFIFCPENLSLPVVLHKRLIMAQKKLCQLQHIACDSKGRIQTKQLKTRQLRATFQSKSMVNCVERFTQVYKNHTYTIPLTHFGFNIVRKTNKTRIGRVTISKSRLVFKEKATFLKILIEL